MYLHSRMHMLMHFAANTAVSRRTTNLYHVYVNYVCALHGMNNTNTYLYDDFIHIAQQRPNKVQEQQDQS